jgi:hypothetical protein
MIQVFEREKTFHASDRSATVIGNKIFNAQLLGMFLNYNYS